MTELMALVLPDLIKHCPFKFQVNPYYKIAKVAADEWLKSYDKVNTDSICLLQ
jgi:hypothetical protein